MSSCNGDTRPVRVILVRAVLTHHYCVANILSLLKWNILESDDLKGTCSFNSLLLGSHSSSTNSLTQYTYSLEYEVSHVSLNLGCRRSCLCSKSLPDSSSKTGRASITVGAGVHHKSRRSLGTIDY